MKNILIHNMGKVASKSILSTLKKSLPNYNIFHSHLIGPKHIKKQFNWINSFPNTTNVLKLKKSVFTQIEKGCEIYNKFNKHPFIVISAIRNPYNHMVSSLFQVSEYLFPEILNNKISIAEKKDIIEKNINYYFEHFVIKKNTPIDWKEKTYALYFTRFYDWWKDEFEPVHKINILNECDPQKKIWTFTKNKHLYIIYRFEHINNVLENLIKYISPDAHFVIEKSNITSQKQCGDIYKRFLSEHEKPPLMLNFYNNHPFTKHFYSKHEQKNS